MAQQSSTTDDLEGSVVEQEELCRQRLEAAEEVVARWGSQGSGACGSPELVAAVRKLLSLSSDGGVYGHRAEVATQTAIAHLEDEFHQVLITGTNLHPPDNLQVSLHDSILLPDRSVSLSTFPNIEVQSVSSFSTTPTDDSQTSCSGFSRDSISIEQVYTYLIDPEAAIVLKEMAEVIILAGHAPNLCHVYGETRHNSLMQCLYLHGVQTETDNVQLDGRKVNLWIKYIKIIVGTVLPEEYQACVQIFGSDKMVEQDCFARATTRCIKELLAFGSAIAKVKNHHYEKVPILLQMHEELAKLQPSLQLLLSGDVQDMICQETNVLLDRLKEASLTLLLEFSKLQFFDYKVAYKTALGSNILSSTVLVMGFLKQLAEHCDLLNLILPHKEKVAADEGGIKKTILPWEHYALQVISLLQLKIVEKSESYKDKRLQYLFLMNNAMYVLEHARTSVLIMSSRDDWIHQHLVLQVEKYATAYFRGSWSTALRYLRSNKAPVNRQDVNENVKNFSSAFEEIIRVQTTWKVPNPQLRQHLRIIILEHVLPAYREYMGRFSSDVYSRKYLKYTPEDIENHVLDLFEG